jgi:hypothetical protein
MKNPHINVIPIVPAPSGTSFPPSSAQEGQIWWDSGQNDVVVFLNGVWQVLSSGVAVHMDYDAERAIDWAIVRMNDSMQETDLAAMAAKYPIVADAIGQLEVALKLCRNLDEPE